MKKQPPCEKCQAYCCKQRGHDFAVLLADDEVEQYEHAGLNKDQEWCLPYVDGKCVYLGDDDRCSIYDRRPQLCRDFNCVLGYKLKGDCHSYFLEDHPEVVSLIELHVINSTTS